MSLHPGSRGVGLNVGKASATNLNGGGGGGGGADLQSPSATILDTLKKKMNLLKEELEVSKDELERARQLLDEERRRRECVNSSLTHSFFLSFEKLFLLLFNLSFSNNSHFCFKIFGIFFFVVFVNHFLNYFFLSPSKG